MSRHTWRTRGIYVWRCRKPYALADISLRWMLCVAGAGALTLHALDAPWWPALLLLLLSGRHTAYVGMTSSRWHRDRQHLESKPWADLNPRCWAIPCLFHGWRWARLAQEAFWIWLLMPVYNVQLNMLNPRRIKPWTALQQRRVRDLGRRLIG